MEIERTPAEVQIRQKHEERNRQLENSGLSERLVKNEEGEPVIFMGMNVLEGEVKTLNELGEDRKTNIRVLLAPNIEEVFYEVNERDSWAKRQYGEKDFDSLAKLYVTSLSMLNKNRPSISAAGNYQLVKEIFDDIDENEDSDVDLTIIMSHGTSHNGDILLLSGIQPRSASHVLREYKKKYYPDTDNENLNPVLLVACSGENDADFDTSGFPAVYQKSGKLGALHARNIVYKK